MAYTPYECSSWALLCCTMQQFPHCSPFPYFFLPRWLLYLLWGTTAFTALYADRRSHLFKLPDCLNDWCKIGTRSFVSCNFLVRSLSSIPTRIWSQMFSSQLTPNSQCSKFIQSPNQSHFSSPDQGICWWKHAYSSIMFLWGTKYSLNCLNSAKIISKCNVSKNKWPTDVFHCFPLCSVVLLVKICTSPELHKMLLSIQSFSWFVECEVGWGYNSSLVISPRWLYLLKLSLLQTPLKDGEIDNRIFITMLLSNCTATTHLLLGRIAKVFDYCIW